MVEVWCSCQKCCDKQKQVQTKSRARYVPITLKFSYSWEHGREGGNVLIVHKDFVQRRLYIWNLNFFLDLQWNVLSFSRVL